MGTDRLKGAAASVDDPSTEAAAPFLYPKNRKQTLRRYLLRQFCKITGRHGYQRIISVVNHKSRCAAGGFPDVFSLDIVDLHFIIGASLGIPCCQGSGLFKYPNREALSLLFLQLHESQESPLHGTTSLRRLPV